jgi:hypothetical protein
MPVRIDCISNTLISGPCAICPGGADTAFSGIRLTYDDGRELFFSRPYKITVRNTDIVIEETDSGRKAMVRLQDSPYRTMEEFRAAMTACLAASLSGVSEQILNLSAGVYEVNGEGLSLHSGFINVDTVAPTVDDDIDSGIPVGGWWIDSTSETVYIVIDNTAGGAVWKELCCGGSGGGCENPIGYEVYTADNATVVATGPGVSVSNASGVATVSIPADVDIHSIQFTGTDIETDSGDYTVSMEWAGSRSFNINPNNLHLPSGWTVYGPYSGGEYVADKDLADVKVIGVGDGSGGSKLELKIDNLSGIYNPWGFALNFGPADKTDGLTSYFVGNAWVVATGSGVGVSNTGGTTTVSIPDGVHLHSIQLESDSSETVDGDLQVKFDWGGDVGFNQSKNNLHLPAEWALYNAATKPYGGPTAALPFFGDTYRVQMQVIDVGGGELTIRAVDVSDIYDPFFIGFNFSLAHIPSCDVPGLVSYFVGNTWVIATGGGVSISNYNGLTTVIVPDGVDLFSLTLWGTEEETDGDGDLNIQIDWRGTRTFNLDASTLRMPVSWTVTNASTDPVGGPTSALPYIIDDARVLRQVVSAGDGGGTNARLTLRMASISNIYNPYLATITFA